MAFENTMDGFKNYEAKFLAKDILSTFPMEMVVYHKVGDCYMKSFLKKKNQETYQIEHLYYEWVGGEFYGTDRDSFPTDIDKEFEGLEEAYGKQAFIWINNTRGAKDTRSLMERSVDHYHDVLLSLQHFVDEHPEREHEIVDKRNETEYLLRVAEEFKNR